MSVTINNYASSISSFNLNKNINSLSDSIEKLSSGLRINRAADDAASMYIGDQLNSQALSLGQAVRNANDGISIMQIVDSALDESINIMQSIKTKAVQAAQDIQTTTTRRTIQEDINKLLEELDLISQSTSFNDHKLLSGGFTDKKFQVGAYSGERIPVSLGSSGISQIGHLRTGEITVTNSTGGNVSLSFTSNYTGETLDIQSVAIEYNNSADNSMAALAGAINKYTDVTGISAQAVVSATAVDAVQAGSTDADFAVNGVTIGAVTTLANDSDSALVTAINNKNTSHGITASTTSAGQLKLTSDDGRPIEVTGSGSSLLAADAAAMSTFGYVKIHQQGAYDIDMTDTAAGLAVSFTNNLVFAGVMTSTIDSTLTADSILATGSTLDAGWTAGSAILGADLGGNIVTTLDSTLKAGTVLASGTVIEKNSVIGGTFYNNADITTTGDSLLKAGSILQSGTTLELGTYLTNDIEVGGVPVLAGETLSADSILSANANLSNDMLLLNGSVIASGAKITAGSYIGADFTLSSSATLSQDMTLKANSTIVDADGVTSIAAGSTIGGSAILAAAVTVSQSMNLPTDSTLANGSELATGSTIGGNVVLSGDHTTSADLLVAANSILTSGSVLKTGTVLANDIDGGILSAGDELTTDYTTTTDNTLNYNQTLKKESILKSGTTLAANSGGAANAELANETEMKLSDLNVLTMEGAQTAIAIADAALDDLSTLRSSAGATQNQFSSSVANLTSTKLNIQNAYSKIMDVDFTEETLNFTKLNILTQSGSFAVAQANAVFSSVIGLLQGGSGNGG